jgi:nicotinate-nucleotide adenylyltransferase
MSKKLAIFGGTFDPPHNGHILSISNILNSALVDEVMLVPSGDGRYDKKPIASAKDRKEMLRLVVESEFTNDPRLYLNFTQIDNLADKAYTIDLLDSIKAKHPEHKLFFVIGSDNIESIKSWRSSERLLSEYSFIVVGRGTDTIMTPKEGDFSVIKGEFISFSDVSSAKIRDCIKARKSLAGMLPKSIVEYISHNSLYY